MLFSNKKYSFCLILSEWHSYFWNFKWSKFTKFISLIFSYFIRLLLKIMIYLCFFFIICSPHNIWSFLPFYLRLDIPKSIKIVSIQINFITFLSFSCKIFFYFFIIKVVISLRILLSSHEGSMNYIRDFPLCNTQNNILDSSLTKFTIYFVPRNQSILKIHQTSILKLICCTQVYILKRSKKFIPTKISKSNKHLFKH